MSAIKPDCLCLIVGLGTKPEWNGRIVTAVKPFAGKALHRGRMRAISGWVVEAPWLPIVPRGWVLSTGALKPLNDPQVDLTADYPLMLEDKLREVA